MSLSSSAPPSLRAEHALEARGLSKRYGGHVRALREIDLVVPWGAVTGLVGPNAAGKSTLLNSWMGFERPTSGVTFVDGLNPLRSRVQSTRRIGYVPQSPALYRELTVADHLGLAKHLRSDFDPAITQRRLRDLGIPLGRSVATLSGGEAAQVGLALALGTRAPILLLDEPLSSLDPLARREFIAVLLDAVRADGVTVVISSHVVSDIEQACDRLVVLGVGQKLLDDSIAAAIETHRLVDGSVAEQWPTDVVGEIPDHHLGPIWLVRWRGQELDQSSDSVLPNLEEVVLGYLRAGRSRSEGGE